MNNDEYTNKTLAEALGMLRTWFEQLEPIRSYTITELQAIFPECDRNKIVRTFNTFKSVGFIETDSTGKRFRIGQDLLLLPYRYMEKLQQAHDQIKSEINSFEIGGDL